MMNKCTCLPNEHIWAERLNGTWVTRNRFYRRGYFFSLLVASKHGKYIRELYCCKLGCVEMNEVCISEDSFCKEQKPD